MKRSLLISILLLLPLAGRSQDAPAVTAWELNPYRVQLLTAVDADSSLSGRFEKDLPGDLAARFPSLVGAAWKLTVAPAPAELRQRIVGSISSITAEQLPAAVKKEDKVILLGVGENENGFLVRARELDLVTGLWNTTATRNVRQAGSVRQEALGCVLSAFAPQARVEKVEEGLVTLKLRAAALGRPDSGLSLVPGGTVFRPVLVKCNSRGEIQRYGVEKIAWTYFEPTEAKVSTPFFTARILTRLSGTPLPEYHPARLRLALGVSPSRDSTKLKLVVEGTSTPLEGYEVAAQEPGAGGKPGAVVSLGRSGQDGTVVVSPSPSAVRTLLVRHGEEVLARLPVVPGLTEDVTISLPDDGPRLAVETALSRIRDELVDLVARREVLASRAKAAASSSDTAAVEKLKDQLRKLPGVDPFLAEIGKQQQAADSLPGPARQKMQSRVAELRKLAEKLRSDKPAEKL